MLGYFKLEERGSTVGREFRGAAATFLTMAYILVVNAGILSNAGLNFQSAVACTALAAGICCLLMGFIANFPLALASGMGLNAVVAFTIAREAGSWQTAMGVIVLDGILTTILVLVGLREAVMNAIPRDLRLAIGAGIGLFIATIGLVNAGIIVSTKMPVPPLKPGLWHDPVTATALIGLVITAVLVARRIPGALILGILLTTVVGYFFKIVTIPDKLEMPSFANAFQADIKGALRWDLLPLLFAVVMVDFFDTLGTASAVAEEAKLVDERGQIPGVKRILLVDSISASIGGLLGASSVTSYIESASGVAEGARTGLHTVFVGLFFLAAIFLAPVAAIIPGAATAPVLVLVGFLMMASIVKIRFDDYSVAIPAFVTMVTIPLSYSIAHGIGYGFILYAAIKLFTGQWKQVSPILYGVVVAFLGYFLFVEK